MSSRVDHTGKPFGYLTALSFSRTLRSAGLKNRTLWLARCVCGKVREFDISQLKRGKTKSCGCLTQAMKSKNSRLSGDMETFNRAYATHKWTAKSRSYSNHLTREQYISIIKTPCRYCGGFSSRKTRTSLNNNLRTTKYGSAPVVSNSVDRLNNEPYYALDNSVSACFKCQQMKWTCTEEGFYEQIEKVLHHRAAQSALSEKEFYSQFDSIEEHQTK